MVVIGSFDEKNFYCSSCRYFLRISIVNFLHWKSMSAGIWKFSRTTSNDRRKK